MHIGVAGAGRIGAVHAATLAGCERVTAVSVYDAVGGTAIRLVEALRASTSVDGRDISIETVDSVDALFACSLDGIVIAAPTPFHAELIHRAADAGIAIFCEKPIALDLETTDAVVEHVRASGVIAQIGFQRRFDVGFVAARAMLATGQLGRLYTARINTFDPAPPPEAYVAGSGGIHRDLHIHDFDAIQWVTGQGVSTVYATGSVLQHPWIAEYNDVDTSVVVLTLEDGALAVATGSRTNPLGYDVRLELLGEQDNVSVGIEDRMPLRSLDSSTEFDRSRAYPNFTERFADAYRTQLIAFVQSIESGIQVGCTVEEARAGLAVAIAADRSRAESRPVAIGEVG